MKTFQMFGVYIVLLMTLTPGYASPKSSQECGSGWVSLQERLYYFSEERLNWQDAQAKCKEMYSNLVKIECKAENDLIVTTIKTSGLNDKDYWIGLNDIQKDGDFTWISDNTNPGFTNWAPGEPRSTKNYDCVQLWRRTNFKWDDFDCSDMQNFICEKTSNFDI